MGDCDQMWRRMISYPVEGNGQLLFEGLDTGMTVLSSAVDGSGILLTAGISLRDEPHPSGLKNLGRVVELQDPCDPNAPSRLVTESLIKLSPCDRCFECDPSGALPKRYDITAAPELSIQVHDEEGGAKFRLYACGDGGAKCHIDSRECAAWNMGTHYCGECSGIYPSGHFGSVLAEWHGFAHVTCENCIAGWEDVVYSASARVLCHVNEEADPCELEYYLLVTAFVNQRVDGECPPHCSCLRSTIDWPFCLECQPPNPPCTDPCSGIYPASWYAGCIRLPKIEQACGAFDVTLPLGAVEFTPGLGCRSDCSISVTLAGVGKSPHCRPCFDLDANCDPPGNAVNPRYGISVANTLLLDLHYPSGAGACCHALLDDANELTAYACAPEVEACLAENLDDGCEFEPDHLIARWRATAYIQDECDDQMVLVLVNATISIFCWEMEVGAPCHAVVVDVCTQFLAGEGEECCAPTAHYRGCRSLGASEACGGGGRFADGLTVPLKSTDGKDCEFAVTVRWGG